ncbi:MAG TPA: methionyl-tRNA formyltransferase [Aquiluna sp.]
MRLIFAGTPAIAAQALEELSRHHEIVLAITREDAPVGRKRVITPSAVAQSAERLGIKTLKTSRVTDHLEEIAGANAELAVVVAYGALVPQSALEIMPWWNLHYSLLPAWRGATPLQHSMIFDSGIGITIFELEKGLDTGPVIRSVPMEFLPQEIASEALIRFTTKGTELLLETLKTKPDPKSQQGEPSLAPKISRAEAKIDFNQPADRIERMIHALNPEPTAWTNFAGQPLKLLRARSLGAVDWEALDSLGSPGVMWQDENRVLIGCGGGTRLEIIELQPAGKKPMTALEFIRGQQGRVTLD